MLLLILFFYPRNGLPEDLIIQKLAESLHVKYMGSALVKYAMAAGWTHRKKAQRSIGDADSKSSNAPQQKVALLISLTGIFRYICYILLF